MSSRKFCDKCQAIASSSDLKCTNCGGTSFTWKQTETSDENLMVGEFPSWNQRSSSNAYDPGVIEGLLDTTFDKYVTKKIVRFAYFVSLVSAALIAVFSFVGLWITTKFTESESALPFLVFVLGFSLIALLLVLWLAFTRLKLESFTALVDISRNTKKSNDV